MKRRPPRSTPTATLVPYTTLFRSHRIRQLAPRPPVHKPVFIAGNGRQPPSNLPQHRRSFVGRVTDGTSPDPAQLLRSAGEGRLRSAQIEIGRALGRERGCQYVMMMEVAVEWKKKEKGKKMEE